MTPKLSGGLPTIVEDLSEVDAIFKVCVNKLLLALKLKYQDRQLRCWILSSWNILHVPRLNSVENVIQTDYMR